MVMRCLSVMMILSCSSEGTSLMTSMGTSFTISFTTSLTTSKGTSLVISFTISLTTSTGTSLTISLTIVSLLLSRILILSLSCLMIVSTSGESFTTTTSLTISLTTSTGTSLTIVSTLLLEVWVFSSLCCSSFMRLSFSLSDSIIVVD